MKKLLLVLFMVIFGGHVYADSFDYSAWDHLLKNNVIALRQGQATQINYRGMKADHAALKAYLVDLSSVTPQQFNTWAKSEQLAFLINAYNAWTVELVLTGYPDITSIKELGSLFQSPWRKEFIPLLGRTRSLDDIEHGLIRAEGVYQEPRVHFAVNCASIGCPALRPEAYTGARLSAQLDDATRQFLRDRTRNRQLGDKLEVSSIFKWYRGDFEQGWGGFQSLPQFFIAYADALELKENDQKRLLAGAIDIEFLDYDWRLNSAP